MYSSQNRVARYYNTNAARRSELDELVHVRDARGSGEKLARSGAPDHSVACNDGLLVSGDVRHRHDREGRITGGGRITKSKAYAGTQDGRGLDSVSLDSAGRRKVDGANVRSRTDRQICSSICGYGQRARAAVERDVWSACNGERWGAR